MYLDLEVEFKDIPGQDLDELREAVRALLAEKYPDYEIEVTEQDRDED